jgi:antagonist of KipI
LEMSFPATVIRFHAPALIAISGADFSPKLNGRNIPVHRPVLVAADSELKFTKHVKGAWCYLTVQGGFKLSEWLGSNSTNTKANVGGLEGRFLRKGDKLTFRKQTIGAETKIFPWWADVTEFYESRPVKTQSVMCTQGNEFDWLTKKSQKDFLKHNFIVSRQSDRMGYRLVGPALKQAKKQELLSTGVSFGTIQLLPNGELIALMADHQTTGGYPRIAHVISADRSRLAQCRPKDDIYFSFVDQQTAEDWLINQEQSLRQLQLSCNFKLREIAL